MPTFEITAPDGKAYHVEGDNAEGAADALHQKLGGAKGTAAASPSASERPSVAADVAKSAGVGLAKGAIGLGGMVGDLSDLGAKGIEKASNFISDRLGIERYQRPAAPSVLNSIPTADSLQKNVEGVIGEFYKPKTVAGEYAQTAGEFAPALVGGPEAIGAKLISRVAVPTAISETAGQLTKGTAAEPYARVAGAIVGGGGSKLATAGYERAANLVNGSVDGMSRGAGSHLIKAVDADGPAAVQARLAELGPDAMLADAGPALLGKAQGASLNSDEGRSVLQNALKTRDTGTVGRIQSDVNKALGPAEDPQTVTDAIKAHRTAIDSVNYPAALDNAPSVKIAPIMSELIDRIEQTPSGSMEHKALSNLQDMLTKTERRPLTDASGFPQYDRLGNQKWQDVPVSHDDAGILHKVKGELDNVIEYDAPGLGVPAGALQRQQGALKQMRGAINSALEDQVPGYANANAVSAALAKRGEAVNLGTQLLNAGKTSPSPPRFAAAFNPLEQGEKIAFAKGSRGDIDRVLGQKANDLQALRGSLQGEGGWNTANLATVHGQPAADALVSTVDRNLKFRDTHTKVVEGSQTDLRNAARKAMKPDPSTETALFNPNSTMTGIPLTLAKKGASAVVNALLQSDPTRHYGEVARALTQQGAARDATLAKVVDAIGNRQRNAATAGSGTVDAVTAALLAHQGNRIYVGKSSQGQRP